MISQFNNFHSDQPDENEDSSSSSYGSSGSSSSSYGSSGSYGYEEESGCCLGCLVLIVVVGGYFSDKLVIFLGPFI